MKFYKLAEACGKVSVSYFEQLWLFCQISTAVFLSARSVGSVVGAGCDSASRILMIMTVTVQGFILNKPSNSHVIFSTGL